MDFDSPDVMKHFPGLYASELNKKATNDSDYSDENEKTAKEMLIGKRKDKKDKERGYAALEGESSADENYKSRSPSKSKKTKSFKFTSKTKESKREKSREKDVLDRKKDRDKKIEKKIDKEKNKSDKTKKIKQSIDDIVDIADALPVFGVSLDVAIERSPCHDGINIPLPVRECVDYIETVGISYEGLYKVNGTKSKVLHLRKMYNQRDNVNFSEYDIPTITSLLKSFIRDLPESIFTNEQLIRFEEAGAILNPNTREKHLKTLIDNLPSLNQLLLSYLITHFNNITLNEKINKMSKQSMSIALNHTFHCSSRLLNVLLNHCQSLFPNLNIEIYIPPLGSGLELPDDPQLIEIELKKQESLLSQIHKEMNAGCISKQREELLWEVQRIITQLKRKLKTVSLKDKEFKSIEENNKNNSSNEKLPIINNKNNEKLEIEEEKQIIIENNSKQEIEEELPNPASNREEIEQLSTDNNKISEEIIEDKQEEKSFIEIPNELLSDKSLQILQLKNNYLKNLKETLEKEIDAIRTEIIQLKSQINEDKSKINNSKTLIIPNDDLDKVMNLLYKENQILQIKKINLVRQIIEQQELCIDLKSKLLIKE